MSEVTKNDLKELKDELSVVKEEASSIKKLYEEELQRESAERDSQATVDSQQAEISAKALEDQKVLEQEQRDSDKLFQETITKFLEEYVETNADIKTLSIERAEEEQTSTEQYQLDMKVGLWLVVFVIVASNISNIFFNRMLRSWN